MKVVLLLCVVVAAALARPQGPSQILHFENENIGVDGYKFAFETSDPISRFETGEVKNLGDGNAAVAVHGEYSYTGGDGKTHSVSYVADEHGFQPHTKTS